MKLAAIFDSVGRVCRVCIEHRNRGEKLAGLSIRHSLPVDHGANLLQNHAAEFLERGVTLNSINFHVEPSRPLDILRQQNSLVEAHRIKNIDINDEPNAPRI